MNFKNQNMFENQVLRGQMQLNQNPVMRRTVSELKAMSMDPSRRNQVLSTLSRFQTQMNVNDYNEILNNVKSLDNNIYGTNNTLGDKSTTLQSKKQITERDYQSAVSSLKRLEREMRYR